VPETEATAGTKQVGIDLGLKTLATCSDGRKIEAPRWYRNQQRRIAEHQRKKRSRQARNLQAKIANRRKDFLHKESDRLTKECELIVVGDVRSAKLTKTNMAKSVNDSGWAMFKTLRLRGRSCTEKSLRDSQPKPVLVAVQSAAPKVEKVLGSGNGCAANAARSMTAM